MAELFKRKCETCGNVFEKYKSQVVEGRGKYCSLSCIRKGRKFKFEKKPITASNLRFVNGQWI